MALPLTYNWRNLFVRKLSTLLTFTVVAVVVGVLAVLLSFAEGIRQSLRTSGSYRNVLVLKTGATAESTSLISTDEAGRVIQTPGIARTTTGEPLISRELCVQTSIRRRGPDANPANVAVRGVDPLARQVHTEIEITEGRWFNEGASEVVVGKAASLRYTDLGIGDRIELGRTNSRLFEVVGIFAAGGGPLESEVWAERGAIADAYNRSFVSSIFIHLDENASIDDAIAYIRSPAVALDARTEIDYYEELTSKSVQIVALTTILIAIMATGAVFAVANTMYAAVDGRRREFAMLRTIGFSRGAILISLIIESLMISLMACLVGLIGASFVSGRREDFLSDMTWTVLAYELRMTPAIVAASLAVAAIVGVGGAIAPAVRASRIPILEALRKA